MIDSHAHLHLINRETTDILQAATNAGVRHIIQVAIDFDSIQTNIDVYSDHNQISITGGIHPLSVNSKLDVQTVLSFIRAHSHCFCAIGETGLDYKYGEDQKELQKKWFIAQLDLAADLNFPVIIHSRHSDDDMLAIVNQYPMVKKVFHCYATNLAFYESLSGNLNYVSFTGMITYAKKGKVVNALRHIPMDRIMIETDAPYLLPKGIEADQNAPEFVSNVGEYIAQLRGIDSKEVFEQTTNNALAFFKGIDIT
jgi:TatD DNase family protein